MQIRIISSLSKFKRLILNDRGASLVEYALLLALIAVLAMAAIKAVGQNASANFQSVNEAIGGP